MNAIGKRLERLEQAERTALRSVLVWREQTETSEQAIERRLAAQPDINPARTKFLVFSWMAPA